MSADYNAGDVCHFCKDENAGYAGYARKDEDGAYQPACFACASQGNPVPKQFRKADGATAEMAA